METDWAAVGAAISERIDRMGATRTDVARAARISTATLRELEGGVARGSRSPAILARLSVALLWPADALQTMVRSGTAPDPELFVADDSTFVLTPHHGSQPRAASGIEIPEDLTDDERAAIETVVAGIRARRAERGAK